MTRSKVVVRGAMPGGSGVDLETKEFYDQYWPRNVPILEETRRYMLDTISERDIEHALDAGCGHGLCSVVLADIADQVTAVDISTDSLETARQQVAHSGRTNIELVHQDLQFLDFPDESHDLVWCWGVAMMAPDPMKVIDNMMRVTRPGGVLYLGVYLKTWLSPVHQVARHFCRTFLNGPARKRIVGNVFASITRWICRLRGEEINVRSDNHTIQAQVEDWFYPPYKTFFSIHEVVDLLARGGFEATCIQDRVGRMKSATIFVVKGVKSDPRFAAVPSAPSVD